MIPKMRKDLGALLLLLQLQLRPEFSKGKGQQELSTMTESKGKSKLVWERFTCRVSLLGSDVRC